MKPRVWLLVSWPEAERLTRGELPRSVQRRTARLLKGATLPPKLPPPPKRAPVHD
jgi:hypothetical protein